MTITDLASIRLQPENWQQFISDGLLSITFHAAKDPDDKVMGPTSPTDKHQFKLQITTATAHSPVIPPQTVTGQTMTTQMPTMDGYKDAKSSLVQQMATESFLRGCKHKNAITMVKMNRLLPSMKPASG